jgi:hypothetical protein
MIALLLASTAVISPFAILSIIADRRLTRTRTARS